MCIVHSYPGGIATTPYTGVISHLLIMALFDNSHRTEHNKRKYSDPIYTFLNNSAWESVKYIREKLEDWAIFLKPDNDFINSCATRVVPLLASSPGLE